MKRLSELTRIRLANSEAIAAGVDEEGHGHILPMLKICLALTAALVLAPVGARAQSDSAYAKPLAELETFVSESPIGGSDVWLLQLTSDGKYTKVAFIFGMADDMGFCWQIADGYRTNYPNSRLVCLQANEAIQGPWEKYQR